MKMKLLTQFQRVFLMISLIFIFRSINVSSKSSLLSYPRQLSNNKFLSAYIVNDGTILLIHTNFNFKQQNCFQKVQIIQMYQNSFQNAQVARISNGVIDNIQQLNQLISNPNANIQVDNQNNIKIKISVLIGDKVKIKEIVLEMRQAFDQEFKKFLENHLQVQNQLTPLIEKIKMLPKQHYVQNEVKKTQSPIKIEKIQNKLVQNMNNMFNFISQKSNKIYSKVLNKAQSYKEDYIDSGKLKDKLNEMKQSANIFMTQSSQQISQKIKDVSKKTEIKWNQMKQWVSQFNFDL